MTLKVPPSWGFFVVRYEVDQQTSFLFSFFRLFSTKKQSLTTYLEVVEKGSTNPVVEHDFWFKSVTWLNQMYDWVSSQKNIQGDSTKSNKKLEKRGFPAGFFFSWQRGLVLIQISRKWELHPRDIIMWSQKREAAFWQFFFWFADINYVLSADDLIQIWRWGKEFFSRQITGWQQEFFAQNNTDYLDFWTWLFFSSKGWPWKDFSGNVATRPHMLC